ncbi:Photosystem I reaction center subunit N, chloroplastic [Zea mays]|uniref:Photosystem I reaction center subunit N, chloroplastic n=3 Tax=Zea mays TaxID=4577 RepID=A0A804N6F5_MAIZE|nr:Photosystem I reaction center subunit N, chloroplastic [Zea mays]
MPSQWDGSSLTLSTRPRAAPQPSPSSISFPPPHPRSKTYKTIATPSPSLSLLQPNQARTTRHQVEELERAPIMAGVNSSVVGLKPAAAVPQAAAASSPAKRVQLAAPEGRRAALLGLAAVFAVTATTGSAKATIFDEYLEKSKANKELNDKKRLATSGANFARAYTVEFGSCQFPYNFTGCQDLAKQKKVPFISDDLEIECEGKEKFKCGSNVFWKW